MLHPWHEDYSFVICWHQTLILLSRISLFDFKVKKSFKKKHVGFEYYSITSIYNFWIMHIEKLLRPNTKFFFSQSISLTHQYVVLSVCLSVRLSACPFVPVSLGDALTTAAVGPFLKSTEEHNISFEKFSFVILLLIIPWWLFGSMTVFKPE